MLSEGELKTKMEIYKEFKFEAAHFLPNVPEGHKCSRLHGHSYGIDIWATGPVDEDSGWVLELADISRAFDPVCDQLDHHFLNEVDGLCNPTSENLARWIWDRLAPALPLLSKVIVHETRTSGCVYQVMEG